MTSRARFDLVAEIDGKSLDAINAKLRRLAKVDAQSAIKKGFSRWTRDARKVVRSLAPPRSSGSTTMVRGKPVPNGHIRDSITTRMKGYRQGQIVWAGVGVKEQYGSYSTPHWYLGWVEYGHAIRRKRRGPQVGYVHGRAFLKRSIALLAPRLPGMVEEAISEVLDG